MMLATRGYCVSHTQRRDPTEAYVRREANEREHAETGEAHEQQQHGVHEGNNHQGGH